MRARIFPSKLSGTVCVPSSKSIAHRALICAALADKPTKIQTSTIYEMSDDVDATIDCLRTLGANIVKRNGTITVYPIEKVSENIQLFCCESGSTLRFILPVAAALGKGAELHGEGRLNQRPIGELCAALQTHGVIVYSCCLPLKIGGKMFGGRFTISGNISSQFISGLLLALPLTDIDSYIVIKDGIESKPYIDMTIAVMREFGIEVSFLGNIVTVRGGQKYKSPDEYCVESDWSSAAPFLCANLFDGNRVDVSGLSNNSLQGDSRIAQLLTEKKLTGLNVKDIPDLVPCLAAASCLFNERTVFTGAARLRLKESDRLESTTALIESLGGRAEAGEDNLIVYGSGSLRGGEVDSFGDHRIVMAAAVAATQCSGETVINNCGVVSKSFPDFFNQLISIGGNVTLEEETEK